MQFVSQSLERSCGISNKRRFASTSEAAIQLRSITFHTGCAPSCQLQFFFTRGCEAICSLMFGQVLDRDSILPSATWVVWTSRVGWPTAQGNTGRRTGADRWLVCTASEPDGLSPLSSSSWYTSRRTPVKEHRSLALLQATRPPV